MWLHILLAVTAEVLKGSLKDKGIKTDGHRAGMAGPSCFVSLDRFPCNTRWPGQPRVVMLPRRMEYSSGVKPQLMSLMYQYIYAASQCWMAIGRNEYSLTYLQPITMTRSTHHLIAGATMQAAGPVHFIQHVFLIKKFPKVLTNASCQQYILETCLILIYCHQPSRIEPELCLHFKGIWFFIIGINS